MRIGIFGGSFDPVHYAHLLLAEMCREQCRLDEVWFLPAAIPPHKATRDLAPPKARVEMLELVTAGHHAFSVSTIELDRGGVSYTVNTLSELKRKHNDADFFFLMGADSLRDLPTWREPRRICELATPVIVGRAGLPDPNFDVLSDFVSSDRLEEIRRHQVKMPLIDLASTDIRERAAKGQSIRYRTPRAIEKYIQTHKLYREAVLSQ